MGNKKQLHCLMTDIIQNFGRDAVATGGFLTYKRMMFAVKYLSSTSIVRTTNIYVWYKLRPGVLYLSIVLMCIVPGL